MTYSHRIEARDALRRERARVAEATELKNAIGSLKWRLSSAEQLSKPVILEQHFVSDIIRRLERLQKLENLVLEANR